jgi:hypothetical protein
VGERAAAGGVTVPALLEFGEESTSAGYLHDAGARVRISMPRGPSAGTAIKLCFRLHAQSENQIELRGRVVRSEKQAAQQGGLWPFRVVVQFEASSVPTLSALFNVVAVASATLGERRDDERLRLSLAATVHREAGANLVGMTYDLGRDGARISMNRAPALGERVRVTFDVDGLPPEEVGCRVVRVQVNAHDSQGIWPLQVAVEFERPLVQLAAIAAAARKS